MFGNGVLFLLFDGISQVYGLVQYTQLGESILDQLKYYFQTFLEHGEMRNGMKITYNIIKITLKHFIQFQLAKINLDNISLGQKAIYKSIEKLQLGKYPKENIERNVVNNQMIGPVGTHSHYKVIFITNRVRLKPLDYTRHVEVVF